MTAYVCDASVIFKTLVTEDETDRADRLVSSAQVHVPDLLYAEIANAIRSRIRRGTITNEVGLSLIDDVTAANFAVHAIRPHIRRAYVIASAIDHPAYDCYTSRSPKGWGCHWSRRTGDFSTRCAE
jgi:predicted nucleic acid-binding protein